LPQPIFTTSFAKKQAMYQIGLFIHIPAIIFVAGGTMAPHYSDPVWTSRI